MTESAVAAARPRQPLNPRAMNLVYQEAVKGFTAEEHQIAEANVAKAAAKIDTIKALVDQLAITAPIAPQVYKIPVEDGGVMRLVAPPLDFGGTPSMCVVVS
jgi:multidrug efflux pump subunit AcrA (membrane-fusion protein)